MACRSMGVDRNVHASRVWKGVVSAVYFKIGI
mgnify:CR=1 FL=1